MTQRTNTRPEEPPRSGDVHHGVTMSEFSTLPPLTYAAMMAGEACPGCARPMLGIREHLSSRDVDALHHLREGRQPTTHEDDYKVGMRERDFLRLAAAALVTQEGAGWRITTVGKRQLEMREADNAWIDDHRQTCPKRSSWFSVSGGPTHCSGCCPQPPMSPTVLAQVTALLRTEVARQKAAPPAKATAAKPKRKHAGNDAAAKPLLVTIPVAAEMLSVGRDEVYRLIKAGEIERVTTGKRGARIVVASIEAYVERLKSELTPTTAPRLRSGRHDDSI